jgi:hypothetical protein
MNIPKDYLVAENICKMGAHSINEEIEKAVVNWSEVTREVAYKTYGKINKIIDQKQGIQNNKKWGIMKRKQKKLLKAINKLIRYCTIEQ